MANTTHIGQRALHSYGRTIFVMAILVIACAASASAQTFTMAVTCTSSGQTCTPVYSSSFTLVNSASELITITASPAHCSNLAYALSVDGIVVSTTPFLTPGQTSSPISTPFLAAGTHTFTVQGIGTVSGCNTGTVNSWAGTLVASQGILNTPLPPSLTLTLIGMVALGLYGFGFRRSAQTFLN